MYVDEPQKDGNIPDFNISRSIFALFGPIREAFGSFKAISRKIFTSGADSYVSLSITTLVMQDSKYAPFFKWAQYSIWQP